MSQASPKPSTVRTTHHAATPIEDDEYRNDLEEPDTDSDPENADPVNFWEKKQRELLSSVVDYNLGTLFDLIQENRIDLSPRYQRRFRWDEKRQSRLIESFLMNVPVPPIFLNEDQYGQYSVIDGKQRLMAIASLLRGKLELKGLKVFSDINGKTFDQLPAQLQSVIRVRPTLRAVIILRQSDPDIKFEVFKRLNTGGVRLNAQEIRNSTYPGPLNDLLLELSVDPAFHRILGIKNQSRSAIYREMRDVEFVLRFFTFRDTWNTFTGGMMRHMDTFMVQNQRMGATELASAKRDFLETLTAVQAAFGERAFRRWQPDKKVWRSPVVASLYDAEMFAARGMDPSALNSRQPHIIAELQKMFKDEQFRATVDAATNTPSSFRTRIELISDLLRSAIRTRGK